MSSHLLQCEKDMEAVLLVTDQESAHAQADEILCRALKLLGYRRLAELYEGVGKWYA